MQKLKIWLGLLISLLGFAYAAVCFVFYAWMEASGGMTFERVALLAALSALFAFLCLGMFCWLCIKLYKLPKATSWDE